MASEKGLAIKIQIHQMFKKIEQERDDARREICEVRSNVSTPAEYAAERGWSYLYETKESE